MINIDGHPIISVAIPCGYRQTQGAELILVVNDSEIVRELDPEGFWKLNYCKSAENVGELDPGAFCRILHIDLYPIFRRSQSFWT